MTQHTYDTAKNTTDTGKNTTPQSETRAHPPAGSRAMNINKLQSEKDAPAKVFTLSRKPDKAMQEMMDTITALRHVYEQENQALEKADTQRFMALFDKKIRIARQYESGVQQMIERKNEFKDVAPDLKKKLYAEQEQFSALASDNMKALKRVRNSVKRLGDRIMSVARDAAGKESVNYSASGNLTGQERAVSIGLNESA